LPCPDRTRAIDTVPMMCGRPVTPVALERDGRKALRPSVRVDAGLDAFEERPKCNHESTKIREDHEEEGEIFFVPFVDLRGFVVPAGF
jgi:hypothetical protein